MKRAIILVVALAFMVVGAPTETRAQSGPVLEEVWVAPEVNHGDMLKIYIKGHASGADLRWILISPHVQGKPVSGATSIKLRKEAKKDVNGYIYWDTKRAKTNAGTGVVEIALEDWQGNECEARSVPIKMVAKGAKKASPPSSFKEAAIGPIMMEEAAAFYTP